RRGAGGVLPGDQGAPTPGAPGRQTLAGVPAAAAGRRRRAGLAQDHTKMTRGQGDKVTRGQNQAKRHRQGENRHPTNHRHNGRPAARPGHLVTLSPCHPGEGSPMNRPVLRVLLVLWLLLASAAGVLAVLWHVWTLSRVSTTLIEETAREDAALETDVL